MAWDYIVEHGLITVGIHLLERLSRIRFLKCRIVNRNLDIRVAYSALLRISDGGQYVLVRNLHRPETYGPFGGVYKFRETAKGDLDEMQFKPQDLGPGSDMRNDLRGYLPRKNLPRLCRWYVRGDERETAADCLLRELREELKEIGLGGNRLRPPPFVQLRKVRSVEEGPETVEGQPYFQYRVFEVYEPAEPNKTARRFFRKLLETAQKHPQLLVANAEEITTGRARDNKIIGHHTVYLLGRRRIRHEFPPFAYGVPKPGKSNHEMQ